jgi:16S rRNA G1207 methylase RsmC
MATGTGKTYVAFQIAWKLVKSGHVKRVLYLADRNVRNIPKAERYDVILTNPPFGGSEHETIQQNFPITG